MEVTKVMDKIFWKEMPGAMQYVNGQYATDSEGKRKRWPRYDAYIGAVEVGSVAYGGEYWMWYSHLGENSEAGANAVSSSCKSEEEAKAELEAYVRGWLENFRQFMKTG